MPALLETLAYFNSSLLFTLGSGGRDGRAIHMHMDVQEDDLQRLSPASADQQPQGRRPAGDADNHPGSDADDHNHYLPFRNPTIFTLTSALALNASAAVHGLIKECEAFNTTHDKVRDPPVDAPDPACAVLADRDVHTSMRQASAKRHVANHTIVVHKVCQKAISSMYTRASAGGCRPRGRAYIECLFELQHIA